MRNEADGFEIANVALSPIFIAGTQWLFVTIKFFVTANAEQAQLTAKFSSLESSSQVVQPV